MCHALFGFFDLFPTTREPPRSWRRWPRHSRYDLREVRILILETRVPNKRLKLPGGDRFKGSGVLCPWRGTDCRPTPLRQRGGRPQLKRDPLGSATAMNLIRPILPLLVASVVACHTQTLSANEKDVLIVALG